MLWSFSFNIYTDHNNISSHFLLFLWFHLISFFILRRCCLIFNYSRRTQKKSTKQQDQWKVSKIFWWYIFRIFSFNFHCVLTHSIYPNVCFCYISLNWEKINYEFNLIYKYLIEGERRHTHKRRMYIP